MDKVVLQKQFKDREESYATETKSLISAMQHAIDGIIKFLNLNDEMAQGQFVWQNAQLTEDEIVVLVGVITYPPGATFKTSEGNTIEVSENNADYFKRIIRLGLPLELVATGSEEDVVRFLTSIKEDHKQANELEKQLAIKDDEVPGPKFDLSALTEEQRLSLAMFNATHKK